MRRYFNAFALLLGFAAGSLVPRLELLADQRNMMNLVTDNVSAGTKLGLAVAILDGSGNHVTSLGGTAMVDDAAFTVATTSITPVGAIYRSVLDTVNDGDAGAVAMLSNRILMTHLVDASGVAQSIGGGTQYAVDTALGATPTGNLAIAIRDDALSALVPIEGDAIGLRVDANGALWTINSGSVTVTDGAGALNVIVDSSATLTVTDGAGALNVIIDSSASLTVTDGAGAMNVICDSGCSGGTQYTEDAVAAADPIGTVQTLVRADTPGALVSADGDNVAQRGSNYGAAYVTLLTSAGAVATIASDMTVGTAYGTTAPGSIATYLDFDGVALPTATNVDTELEAVPIAASIKGVQYMMLVSEDGSLQYGTTTTPFVVGDGTGALNIICDSGCSGGTQYAVDTALGATPTGTLALAIRDDALSALTPIEGDGIGLRVDANGALWTINSGSVTVTDGAGALNVIIDSSASLTVTDGAGAMNVICDSGCSGGTQYAEEAAHVSGNTGTLALAVRNNAGTALAVDGAYIPLMVNASGALYVTGGGGGTEYVVNAVAPADPTGATFTMERDDALSALTEIEGDWTNPRSNANGALWTAVDGSVTVTDGAGALNVIIDSSASLTVTDGAGAMNVICDSGCSGGTQYAVDAALGATPTGTLSLAIRDDALSVLTPIEGDAIGLRVDANGALWTINSGSVTVTDGAGALNVIIDSSASLTVTATNLDIQSGGVDLATTTQAASIVTAVELLDNAVSGAGFNITQLAGAATPMTTAQADNLVNTLAGLNVTGFLYGFDGTTWDRVLATGGAVHVTDGAGALNAIIDSGTITTVSTVTTLSQFGGNAINLGAGVVGTGTLRMVIATDDPVNDYAVLMGANLVAHDAVDAGSPLKVGGYASTTPPTAVAAADRVNAWYTLNGAAVTVPGGASVHYRTAAAATEDEHEIKATAGTLYSILITNTNAAARYIRCYNLTAANTTPGTSTVFWGAAIPGATAGAGFSYSFPSGLTFDTALTCAWTTGAADTDVAEVAANEIKATYTYR